MNNLKHLVGILVGLLILKPTGLRFGKEHRGRKWYSTVAANLAADGVIVWRPYR